MFSAYYWSFKVGGFSYTPQCCLIYAALEFIVNHFVASIYKINSLVISWIYGNKCFIIILYRNLRFSWTAKTMLYDCEMSVISTILLELLYSISNYEGQHFLLWFLASHSIYTAGGGTTHALPHLTNSKVFIEHRDTSRTFSLHVLFESHILAWVSIRIANKCGISWRFPGCSWTNKDCGSDAVQR